MQIRGLIFNDLVNKSINMNPKFLSVGNVIEGKILKISNNSIVFKFSDGSNLVAQAEGDFIGNKGDLIRLLVKSADSSRIVMTPVTNEIQNEANSEQITDKILRSSNIALTDDNKRIVKTLLKFKMPIDHKSILDILKRFERLKYILNSDENEIILKENDDSFLTEDIDNLKFLNTNNPKSLLENTNLLHDKANLNEPSNYIRQLINNLLFDSNIDSLLNKVTFLVKMNMKVSFRNLELLSKLLEGDFSIHDDISELFSKLDNSSSSNMLKKLKYNLNDINISTNKEELKNIGVYYSKLNEVIEKAVNSIPDKTKKNELIDSLEQLKEKVQFLGKVNENLTLIYIPFKISEKNEFDNLYILKKINQENKGNRYKVCIRVKSKKFDEIEAMCDLYKESISINIYLESKKYISLFNNRKNELQKCLLNSGFSSVNIKILKNMNKDILDFVYKDENKNYFLDVRV